MWWWNQLVPLLYLVHLCWATDCPKRGVPQNLPPTYTTSSTTPSRTAYEAHIHQHRHINDGIPPLCKDGIRIVKMNANILRNADKSGDNVDSLINDVMALNASVVLFQEMPKTGSSLRKKLDMALQIKGFVHRHYEGNTKSAIGNMIASRLPMELLHSEKIDKTVNIVAFGVDIGGGNDLLVQGNRLVLVTTHIDNANPLDYPRLDKILDFVSREILPKYQNIIIASSLSSFIFNKNSSAKLSQYGTKLEDVFWSLKWPTPKFSSWRGIVQDYILVSDKMMGEVIGAYQMMTTSSDHTPLLVDIRAENADATMSSLALPETMIVFICLGLIVMIGSVAMGFYHWYRVKMDY